MEKKFKIVTDATCDFPASYATENDVVILPMLYSVDGKDYLLMGEGEKLEFKDFYNQMRNGSVVKTAQVNTENALDELRPLVQEGYDLLYLGFSSGLSGTCDSVKLALKTLKEEYPERNLKGIDSLCASLGEGLFVQYGVNMRNEGKSLDEIYDFLEKNKLCFCQYFTVDDLHHLQRGGRVSKVAAIIGTILGIKPVLHVDEKGKLIPIRKVKGRKKALAELVEKMKSKIVNTKQTVFISHGDCIDDANYVASLVTEAFGITDIRIEFIGPVIGTHSGPGTVALFFFGSDRKEK